MAKIELAHEEHPYSPDAWLNVQQASRMLAEKGLYSRVSATRCKQNSINVSQTGHICKSDIEQYIERELKEIEQSKDLHYI